MTIIPSSRSVFLPTSPVFFTIEEFKQITGHTPHKGEDVLITFPLDPIHPFHDRCYRPYGVTGIIRNEDENGFVYIETTYRYYLDYEDSDEDINRFEASVCTEYQDISVEESENCKKQIKELLSNEKEIDSVWLNAVFEVLDDDSRRPEVVLSLQPLCSIDYERVYAALFQDSLKMRAEMTIEYVKYVLSSGKLKKEFEKAASKAAAKMSDYEILVKKVNEAGMSSVALCEVNRILERLKKEPPNTQEYSMLYDYVKRVTDLPWKKEEFSTPDFQKVKEYLDENHFGMEKIKERIIQELSVMTLNKKFSGSIFNLSGSPGVGKTSIGKSIAKALGRKYARVSLGGVHDEAELRGHRRTYIGAMCGRIMDAIIKCGTTNPVIVLDEIDKISSNGRGDPSAALLEILDPEQNSTFTDHYFNFPYDLSDVMFICTSNTLDTIPEPLLNRMEVIRFENYTPSEKYAIAVNHLIPQAIKKSCLPEGYLTLPDDTIKTIISDYTMEGGVRSLKRCFEKICAKAAEKYLLKEMKKIVLQPSQLREFLQTNPIHLTKASENAEAGVVTGLAYTQVGGKILYIETLFTKGNGKTIITGHLGEVMKESAQIAVSVVKSLYPDKSDLFDKNDLHIHVPDGAVPKDGPSAGIALATALASLVTGKAVDGKIAMTGEISLHGKVSAIGGLREKLSGAKAAGITTIFIPDENKDELVDFPAEITSGLNIIPVSNTAKVLELAGISSS